MNNSRHPTNGEIKLTDPIAEERIFCLPADQDLPEYLDYLKKCAELHTTLGLSCAPDSVKEYQQEKARRRLLKIGQ